MEYKNNVLARSIVYSNKVDGLFENDPTTSTIFSVLLQLGLALWASQHFLGVFSVKLPSPIYRQFSDV